MSDERSTFELTRARLEDIVAQVRSKDVSLEQSLDLLEEAVRLVNQCNELVDQTSFRAPAAEQSAAEESVTGELVEIVETAEVVEITDDGVVSVSEIVDVIADPGAGEDADEWGSVDAWEDDVAADDDGAAADDGASEAVPSEVEDDERQ